MQLVLRELKDHVTVHQHNGHYTRQLLLRSSISSPQSTLEFPFPNPIKGFTHANKDDIGLFWIFSGQRTVCLPFQKLIIMSVRPFIFEWFPLGEYPSRFLLVNIYTFIRGIYLRVELVSEGMAQSVEHKAQRPQNPRNPCAGTKDGEGRVPAAHWPAYVD